MKGEEASASPSCRSQACLVGHTSALTPRAKASAIATGSGEVAMALYWPDGIRPHLHTFGSLTRRADTSIHHDGDIAFGDDDT